MNLLEGLLPIEHGITMSQSEIEKVFVFVIMWTFGALLEIDERKKLEELLFKNQKILDLPPVKKEENETIFEYMVSKEGCFIDWRTGNS